MSAILEGCDNAIQSSTSMSKNCCKNTILQLEVKDDFNPTTNNIIVPNLQFLSDVVLINALYSYLETTFSFNFHLEYPPLLFQNIPVLIQSLLL